MIADRAPQDWLDPWLALAAAHALRQRELGIRALRATGAQVMLTTPRDFERTLFEQYAQFRQRRRVLKNRPESRCRASVPDLLRPMTISRDQPMEASGETKPSIRPQTTSSGMSSANRREILSVLCCSDSRRLASLGRINDSPRATPAAPPRQIIDSSTVPWAKMNFSRSPSRPWYCVNAKTPPSISPLFAIT